MSRPGRIPSKRKPPKVFEIAEKYKYGTKTVIYWGRETCYGMFNDNWTEAVFRVVLPNKEIGLEITIPYDDIQKLRKL